MFSPASATTHYLEPLTLIVYQITRDNPGSTLDTLTVRLATHLGIPLTPRFQEMVGESLDSLHRIGLLQST